MTESNHDDEDAKVRSALAESGDDGRTPRRTSFYFTGGNLDGLRAAADREGYSVRPTPTNDGVILEATIAVDEQGFATHRQRMDRWSEEFDSQYHGWECQLLTQ